MAALRSANAKYSKIGPPNLELRTRTKAIPARADCISKERAAEIQHEGLPFPRQSMGDRTAGDAHESPGSRGCRMGSQPAELSMRIEGVSVMHLPPQIRSAHLQPTAGHGLPVP